MKGSKIELPPPNATQRAWRAVRAVSPLALFYALAFTLAIPLCNALRSRGCRDGQAPLLPPLVGALVLFPCGAAIVAVLRPWIHNVYGAALAGWLAVLPVWLAIWATSDPSARSDWEFIFVCTCLSFMTGSAGGALVWARRDRRRTRR